MQPKKLVWIAGIVLSSALTVACSSNTRVTPAVSAGTPTWVVETALPTVVPSPFATSIPTADNRPTATQSVLPATVIRSGDVVITAKDYGKTFVVAVGQKIIVQPPVEFPEWKVMYDEKVLKMLTPAPQIHYPGAMGWLFQSQSIGSTVVTLTTLPPTCQPGAPCSLMPSMQFTVTIVVQ